MNHTIYLSKLAVRDLREIYDYYHQISPVLADQFTDELQLLLDKIAKQPDFFAVKEATARMAMMKKFPHKVFYMVNEKNGRVRIIALLHRSRNPILWKKRLT